MSRPTTSESPSHRMSDASRAFQQPAPLTSPTNSHLGMHPYQRDGPRDSPTAMSVSLPPLRQMSSTPPTPSSERRPGNPLGVHSILNPQADIMEQHRDRRRSGSQRESMSPIESQPPQSLPSISRPTSVDSTRGEPLSNRQFQPPNRPPARHLLSPRSPTLNRTQSLGVLGAPTGTIDAHQSPFLSATTRPYGPEPVTSQPTNPAPSAGSRTYFPQVPPTAPTPPQNLMRNDIRRPSGGFPQSGSASPMASYSPYSQPASIASSHFETSSQQGSYMPNQTNSHQDPHNPPIAMETERSMIPMAPSSQSSIQMMTIKSQQGHHVQIPVDVQAASKVADEKRKRNAGASARFRARRKEKEREASMSISRLEQQIRHAAEDVEYYRAERDYFKTIVFQQPGAERHYARAPSPRLRRTSMPPSVAPSTVGGGSAGSPYSDYEDEEPEPERNVRRRTSNYHPASGPAPAHFNGSGPPSQTYPAPSFPPVNNPPMSRPPPQQQFDPREQRARPDMQQPANQRPLHRDSFAPEPARYENRNWAPEPGRENRG